METRDSSAENLRPVTWPLVGSLFLTAIVVALVCVPPFGGLHSWGHLLWLACLYMLVAAFVHALAMWSIYRIQSEGVREWALVWPAVWGAWIAVVWLPLVALLTYEHSPWVAAILPLTAAFLALFVVAQRRELEDSDYTEDGVRGPLFAVDESPRLWRMLLPALVAAVALDAGAALFAAKHAWLAGCLFAAVAAYFAERLLSRTAAPAKTHNGAVRRGAAGNSLAVWTLTVVALLPFLAGMGLAMRGLLGMPAVQAANHIASLVHRAAGGYTGIILTRPKMPHEIVTPVLTANAEGFRKSREIPFDGQYWYFQPPDARPRADARVVQGDPAKNQIKSTDDLPIVMEAHQRLAQPMEANCCRALKLNLVNADAVPGKITLEVLLSAANGKMRSTMRLGSKVLPSSTVSPMPLHRAPVKETLVFAIPRGAKSRSFDEMTVKVIPEGDRSLAAPEVAIKSFAFQR
jgi:hypothetical protein